MYFQNWGNQSFDMSGQSMSVNNAGDMSFNMGDPSPGTSQDGQRVSVNSLEPGVSKPRPVQFC